MGGIDPGKRGEEMRAYPDLKLTFEFILDIDDCNKLICRIATFPHCTQSLDVKCVELPKAFSPKHQNAQFKQECDQDD